MDLVVVIYVVVYCWWYVCVIFILGCLFFCNIKGNFYFGGDWCLDVCVEVVWISGIVIVDDFIGVC